MGKDLIDGRAFIAAMGHTIGAFFVSTGAIGVPIGFIHEGAEAWGVAFAEEIAGALPAEDIARRHTPR